MTLVKSGVLTTCTHLPYAPFQSKDASGKVVGFDVALIDLVAEKLGVTQEIVDTPFEGIKSGADLNAGKCDVAAAGMTITEERKKVLDFSDAVLRRHPGARRARPAKRSRRWRSWPASGSACRAAPPARTTSTPRSRRRA